MRKTIAKRLEQVKRGVPHFYLTVEVDAAPLAAFRAQLNDGLKDEEKVSVNDLVVKAYALALAATPTANAWYLEDAQSPSVRYHRRVHVGVAVAIPDGLITPIVRDADKLPLARLAATTKELVGRARQKKLKPEEYTNGTGSVSNLGMMGIHEFSAILNPPESTIIAVGALEKRPVFDADGKVVVGERIKLTLSCDHRVVDGALGAELLAKVKKNLEKPAKLAL
jgi:pyruvate dehydrogenase E2 component (dihydrolipoamide acetyltransferase)